MPNVEVTLKMLKSMLRHLKGVMRFETSKKIKQHERLKPHIDVIQKVFILNNQ